MPKLQRKLRVRGPVEALTKCSSFIINECNVHAIMLRITNFRFIHDPNSDLAYICGLYNDCRRSADFNVNTLQVCTCRLYLYLLSLAHTFHHFVYNLYRTALSHPVFCFE